jgi:hypothetical protein
LEAAASLRYVAGNPGARTGDGLEEEGEEEQWFPVPRFFGFPGEEIRHGIVLKGEGPRRGLLLTAVEREIEVPSGELYRPSRLLRGLGACTFLRGLCFWTMDSGDSLPLLLLDPFKLADEMAARAGGADGDGPA